MDRCDVLIVGGGPAGSSCAWGLRRAGLRVILLDKHAFPRDKVCGGWITPPVLTELEIDPGEYGKGRVLQPITGFRVGQIDGAALETAYSSPVSYGVRRCEFDEYLVRRCGARLLLGVALGSLRRAGGVWIANEQTEAGMVVGAGGHFCPVARHAGAKVNGEPAVVAQEVEFEMGAEHLSACQVQREMPELYFCPDLKGYGWCFHKERFLNVGFGRADPHGLAGHVADFLRFLKAAGRVCFPIPPMRGHAYLLRGISTRKAVADGLLLIGDAAGLAYPQSGEGIRPAVESGLLAAQAILSGRPALLDCERQPWVMRAGRLVPGSVTGLLGRGLLRMPWFVRKVVLDEWFLHRDTDGVLAA